LRYSFLIFCFSALLCSGQVDSTYSLEFNFNDHLFKEVDEKVIIRPTNVYLTKDRFGNLQSAVFLQGTAESYLSLGTSPLLKSKNTTISLWVNLDQQIFLGKGQDCNPILCVKNGPGDDFYAAYGIAFDAYSKRFCANSTKDSTLQTCIQSRKPATFGEWHHFVLTSDYNFFTFYIDGELQGKIKKGFETKFLEGDSMVIGHTANNKNFRFSEGTFDDIQIFHKVLNEAEIQDLFNAPNPNHLNSIVMLVLKILLLLGAISVIAFLLVATRRKALKREKERFELKTKMAEMEIRLVRMQINPHFMSNCLTAMQQLIISNKLEAASDYLARFAFIVRQTLNFSTKTMITLCQELEIIKLNIELEQLRFENPFLFNMQVDPALNTKEIWIPPFIFQPIVENAIWHGLMPLQDKRKPRLEFILKKENDSLHITISDNGVGRKLAANGTSSSKDSKGMMITFQRIKNLNELYKVETAKIIYKDLFSGSMVVGTSVNIYLPLILNATAYE
jgi:hypothetical protein